MGYTQITDKEEKQIVAYYLNDHTMQDCRDKFGRSKSTVKRIIDNSKKNGDFTNKVEQIKKDNTNNVLDVLKNDKRLTKTIDNILDIFQNKENVQAEYERKGFQGLNAVMGTIFDKALKYKALEDGIDLLGDGISIKVVNDAR
jgi:predicted DNA-binding protein YlxM (UPF0122 family)